MASADQVGAITQALKFVARVATRLTVQIVIDAGVLDVILRVYICFPILDVTTEQGSVCKTALFESCKFLLTMYVAAARHAEHPVCLLWTACNARPPVYGGGVRQDSLTRRAAWRQVPGTMARQQLMVAFWGFAWVSDLENMAVVDIYDDLIEFTR